ncbi:hypothetical protein CDL12_14186 [Handroanthus impetiginosus]|uniref:Uncharacterized protein n=1 Tax=Handroanthus impetiginosus TaxID=429701 RepID=A0A2G9H6Q4_9LAMI|nr:hypothetical protein CDL12_14186 [Handroanthus impetiginosus]
MEFRQEEGTNQVKGMALNKEMAPGLREEGEVAD